jgi:hypothetical protein
VSLMLYMIERRVCMVVLGVLCDESDGDVCWFVI